MRVSTLLVCLLSVSVVSPSFVDGAEWGLKKGTPGLKSAGSLAFGPDGILIVGDTKSASLFAIDTGDRKGRPSEVSISLAGVASQVGKALGTAAEDISINDLAVNPHSGNVYLSVTQAGGGESAGAIVRVDGSGKVSALSLKGVAHSQVVLPNAPEDREVRRGRRSRNPRNDLITDIAYVDGKVIVSGLSTAASASTVREIAFPFVEADSGSSIEIFHGAHGRTEDGSAIRTFVPFNIDGEPTLLAGYVCTPLVKFPLSSLKAGKKAKGTTIAELGNRNRPLDMIVYEKDGKDFLLMANSARGVMKISTDNIAKQKGITERVGGGGTAGLSYDTINELQGVVQLDKLNEGHAVVLVQTENGSQSLKTVDLP